jgi:hypothetical protein
MYSLKKTINDGTALLSDVADFFLPTLWALINAGKIKACCGKDDQILFWAENSDQNI